MLIDGYQPNDDCLNEASFEPVSKELATFLEEQVLRAQKTIKEARSKQAHNSLEIRSFTFEDNEKSKFKHLGFRTFEFEQ